MKVLYTRALFWAAGFTPLPGLVVIHPNHRDDATLLAHERVHCDQQRRMGVLAFWWRYLTDKAFRQTVEVEAYRAQIAAGGSPDAAARNLVNLERLGIDLATARALLQDTGAPT